jgi:hypothetical protein
MLWKSCKLSHKDEAGPLVIAGWRPVGDQFRLGGGRSSLRIAGFVWLS